MVAEQRTRPSFWNYGNCGNPVARCGSVDDADSIMEEALPHRTLTMRSSSSQHRQMHQQHQHQHHRQGRAPPPPTQSHAPPQMHQPIRTVRTFVDGILSPFLTCGALTQCVDTRMPYDPASHSVATAIPSSANGSATAPPQTSPNPNDVLCGRGNNSNRHSGNQNFRALIQANKQVYGTLTKKEKMLLARSIVTTILHSTDPPARFLGRDPATGLWYDIGMPRSLEKTSQALREKTTAEKECGSDAGASSVALSDVGTDASRDDAAPRPQKTNTNSHLPRKAPAIQIPDQLQHVYHKVVATTTPAVPHATQPVIVPSSLTKTPQQQATELVYVHVPAGASDNGVYRAAAQYGAPAGVPHFRPAYESPRQIHQRGHRQQHPAASHVSPPPAPPSQPHYYEERGPHGVQRHLFTAQHAPPSPIPGPSNLHPSYPGTFALPEAKPSTTTLSPIRHPYPPPRPTTTTTPSNPPAMVTPHAEFSSPSRRDAGPAPAFPLDVFQNPDFAVSPTREQDWKRRRTSIDRGGPPSRLFDNNNHKASASLNASMESLKELDSSAESSHHHHHHHNADLNTSNASSIGLSQAIATQLTLEERVIRSPTELMQSTLLESNDRRTAPTGNVLPKVTSNLNVSADSMDGLAALSTAAFLRLDESD